MTTITDADRELVYEILECDMPSQITKIIASHREEAEEPLRVEINRLRKALRDLLDDTQHTGHDCGDEEWCPVIAARKAIEGGNP